jgi:hydroxypyruvate reductase
MRSRRAGAIVDPTTLERAAGASLAPADTYLNANNTYEFFDALDDLIRTGPTCTNVGDLQVILIA